MNTVPGYAMASWDTGYGDFVFRPDLATLRRMPWLEGTALVRADLEWHDGSPVAPSPRQILRRQLERLAERGWTAMVGSELEFILFARRTTRPRQGLPRPRPANAYNVDYSIFGTTNVEPVLRAIRLGMAGAGMPVEDSKGECNFGQHEVNFRYADALRMADDHTSTATAPRRSPGSRATRSRSWPSSTSARATRATSTEPLGARRACSRTTTGTACARSGSSSPGSCGHARADAVPRAERELLQAVRAGSFAPTALVWGDDNRTCALRVVGHGKGMRVESRVAGGDCNPYLAFAAIIAAGLAGIDNELELEPACKGNAYDAEASPTYPRRCTRRPPARGLGARPRGVRRRGRRRTT